MLGFEATADSVSFVLKTGDKDVEATMDQAEIIWNSSQFREDWPTLVVMTGFLIDPDDGMPDMYTEFTAAFKCRGGYNLLVCINH